MEYQPRGEGSTHSPPEKSKMATKEPINRRRGLERGPTLYNGTLQSSLYIIKKDSAHIREYSNIMQFSLGGGVGVTEKITNDHRGWGHQK